MPTRVFAGAHVTLPILVAMGLGFVFAWPVGLAVLAYALWGERFGWRPRVEAFAQGFAKGLRQDGCRCSPASIDLPPRRAAPDAADGAATRR